MRAKIAGMTVLMGIVALTTSFSPLPLSGGEKAVTSNDSFDALECVLSGRETCIDTAAQSAGECFLDSGIFLGDQVNSLYAVFVTGWCTGVGLWSGLSCAWEWLSGLF